MKVLTAEDDTVSRTVLNRTVEKLGHECLAAKDGLDAWEMYRNTPDVEVIISDWMMPNMNGLEFCRSVRGLDREGYTFFIFLTALGSREHLLEGMQAGADEYLTKPLDVDQLRVKLIAASRVVSLHQRMKVEGNAEAVHEESDGSAPKTEVRAPDPPRRAQARLGSKAWDVLISQGKLTEEQLRSGHGPRYSPAAARSPRYWKRRRSRRRKTSERSNSEPRPTRAKHPWSGW